MDKAKLTFRLNNQKPHTTHDSPKSNNPKPIEEPVTENVAEEEALEQIEPEQDKELAPDNEFSHTRQRSRQLFDEWIHEEQDLSETSSSLYSPYFSHEPVIENRPKRTIPSFFRYVMSIGSAVLTGFLMGMVLLSFVNDDPNLKGFAIPFLSGDTVDEHKKTGEAADQPPATPAAEPTKMTPMAIDLPAQPYYMVQAGVFSEESRADLLVSQLEERGYPALVLPTTDDFRVYVGVAATKEDASFIGDYFKEQQVEAYVKSFAIPAAQTIQLRSDQVNASDIVSFLGQGGALLQRLSQAHSETISGIATAEQVTLEDDLNRWISSSETFRTALTPESEQTLMQMINYMREAVQLQVSSEGQPTAESTWRSQSSLIRYAVTAQAWVQGLAGPTD